MKILTFDIEEWYLRKNDPQKEIKISTYESILSTILDCLDEKNIKATFFCLGKMAQVFPHIVKSISNRGHEIGCHSNTHAWVNKSTPEEFKIDTKTAIDSLQDCIGEKVVSYRAPAFSIDKNSKWAFDILADCGIETDCSIFPTYRDFGGFPTFPGKDKPCKIDLGTKSIIELPINLINLPIVHKQIAYSGGGYFRFMPLWFVKSQIKKSEYVMCYFHLSDLAHFKSKFPSKESYEAYFKEKGTFKNRAIRYFKSNIGKGALPSLLNLIVSFDFISVKEAMKGANEFPTIKL